MKFQQEQFKRNQHGVALVITLIMLSVITFLTVAFLAISRRDRASVTTSLSQTDSHLMADTALARFQSELTARIMASGDLQNYDVMLTRNYINPDGFDPTLGFNLTNVNYDYYNDAAKSPLNNVNDKIQNIANLFYDPRPPVFVRTNENRTLPLDFRFYLDYNRNQRFETNGPQPIVIDEAGNILKDSDGNPIFRDFLGEGEWIGVLQNPEYPHSPTNRFIGRYLYFALPISRTLDLNYIHNYEKGNVGSLPSQVSAANGDGFLRNQGYGSYELNLAAFLHDLNTNMYPDTPTLSYQYFPDAPSANIGAAFSDAVSILSYRYYDPAFGRSMNNLRSVANLFGGNGVAAFENDFIDNYSSQPVLFPPFVNTVDPDRTGNLTSRPWAGSRNPSQFFEPQELFDTSKTSAHFVNELTRVSANNNSYDRYTFSSLLEQIGTGSEPELRGKININYVNDPTQNTVQTNFVEWTPYQFFTNVAERLIKDNLVTNVVGGQTNIYLFNTNGDNLVHAGFSVTNIKIFTSTNVFYNEYTAPLHRLLQVAANIYDSTTSSKYPTIYRPQFRGSRASAYITNFVVETNSVFLSTALSQPIQDRTNVTSSDGLVWGIPVVVAAKKGFPNFNEFLLQSSVQVSRNLELRRPTTNSVPNATNEMLVLGISNVFGLEAWNSYIQPYTNNVRFILTNLLSLTLTNEFGSNIVSTNIGKSVKLQTSFWPGVTAPNSNAFILPLYTNVTFMSNSTYYPSVNQFFPTTTNYPNSGGYPNPTWGLIATNRLVYALVDTSQSLGRVIDFVNLDGMTANIDIMKALLGDNLTAAPPGDRTSLVRELWDPGRIDGSTNKNIPTIGMENQILYSMGIPEVLGDEDWRSYGNQNVPANKEKAIAEFTRIMGFTPTISGYEKIAMPTNLVVQTPFNPVRAIDQMASWQVNDPLVHYMTRDLLDSTNQAILQPRIPPNNPPAVPNNLKDVNPRYRPWGRRVGAAGVLPGSNGNGTSEFGDFAYDPRVKDPRVRWSDDWDFPTNKFPNIGWIGKVHRGTPWQTIYLKAGAITNRNSVVDNRTTKEIGGGLNWENWSGSMETHPTNDWRLVDMFTVAPNDNAARGLLSVNQTNQAAWAAVLSGVVALTNWQSDAQVRAAEVFLGDTNAFRSVVIEPGPAISNIVADINAVRAREPNGEFHSLGDILSVPSLSVGYDPATGLIDSSPFLRVTNYNLVGTNKIVEANSSGEQKNQTQRYYGVTDEAYERIPQQIMSLLKLGEPEFVVYCYGQSLKPAPNSVLVTEPVPGTFNLCTNYQITGEVVTRTVLRVEGTPDKPKTVIESYNILPSE